MRFPGVLLWLWCAVGLAAAEKRPNRRLMDELVRTGDPRVTGDGRTFERPPFTGPVVTRGAGRK